MQSHKYFRTFLPKFHTIWYICMKFLYNFETRSRLMNFQKPYFFHVFPKNTGNYAFFSGILSKMNIFILNAYIYIFPPFSLIFPPTGKTVFPSKQPFREMAVRQVSSENTAPLFDSSFFPPVCYNKRKLAPRNEYLSAGPSGGRNRSPGQK